MDREAWHAAIHGVAKSWHNWATELNWTDVPCISPNGQKSYFSSILNIFKTTITTDHKGAKGSFWRWQLRLVSWLKSELLFSFLSIRKLQKQIAQIPRVNKEWSQNSNPNLSEVRSDQLLSCVRLFATNPMNPSTPRLPVYQQLPEFTQTHVHRISDTIQPSHPLSSPSLLAPNPSQHQSLFQWVNSLHEVAKVLEFQL